MCYVGRDVTLFGTRRGYTLAGIRINGVYDMSRIPAVEPDQASPEVRAIYDKLEGMGFSLMNVFKMFANQ